MRSSGKFSPVGYNVAVKRPIFVVEDDADIARLVRHQLEAAGFPVRTFAQSTGVLSDAEKDPPVLFLLDIMLPAKPTA
jgi:two-component system phosphate regulon response regulator PhoB